MHRIDTVTAQKDKFGTGKNGFTRGNPQTGVPATDLDDDYFDTLQEELAAIVEAAGITLDKAQRNQVLLAAQKLFAPANDTIGALASLVGAPNKLPYFTGSKSATLTDLSSVGRQIIAAATKDAVLTYLGLGDAAKLNVGTASGTVAAGDDPRLNSAFGPGQAWQNVKASRAAGVTYTNSSGKTIAVAISTRNGATVSTATVDAIIVSAFTPNNSGTILSSIFFLVPNGSTYAISSGASLAGTDTSWVEFR